MTFESFFTSTIGKILRAILFIPANFITSSVVFWVVNLFYKLTDTYLPDRSSLLGGSIVPYLLTSFFGFCIGAFVYPGKNKKIILHISFAIFIIGSVFLMYIMLTDGKVFPHKFRNAMNWLGSLLGFLGVYKLLQVEPEILSVEGHRQKL